MRTILSRVILERVSSPREGWRKNKEGGGRASQERRSTFRGKAKWSTKLGYETRRSYFLWRVPLWLAKTGKKTLPLRSFAPLTILWIVRALASSYSSCSLFLSLYLSISSLIYSRRNITNETIFPSREQRRMIDGSRKEISGFQIFRIEKISRRNVSTFVRHKNGECKRMKRGKLFYIYIYRKSVWPRVKVVHVIHMASTLLFVKHWFTFSKVFPFRPSMASKIERNLWGIFAIRLTFVKYRFLK